MNEIDRDELLKACLEYRDKYGYIMFGKPFRSSKESYSCLFFDGASSSLITFYKGKDCWVANDSLFIR